MSFWKLPIVTLCLSALFSAPLLAQHPERLYGRITTKEGETLEGFIRWGSNEAGWMDVFNGRKSIPEENRQELRELEKKSSEEEKGFTFLGIRFFDDPKGSDVSASSSGIRFGHIRSIEAASRSRAVLTLKSGRQVEFKGGSADFGRRLKTTIEDAKRGSVEIGWREIERVDFLAPSDRAVSKLGSRLYGTLKTRHGLEFKGYVTWDLDEVLPVDTLDGEERGRDREIEFGRIRSIESKGRNASRVRLTSDETHVLSDSNDVDSDNRGIIIGDPGFGQVTVPWSEFSSLEFRTPPPETKVSYQSFAPAKRLRGTVHTEGGKSHTGTIRWDNDEEYTWELIDGRDRDLSYEVEFSRVVKLEKKSRHGSLITLVDGRVIEISDSNDVDEDNKGIIVRTERGERVLIRWEEFDYVEFER